MVAPRWFIVGLFLMVRGLLLAAPEVVKREVPPGVEEEALAAESLARSEADGRQRDSDYLLLDRQIDVAAQTDYSRVAMRVVGEGGLPEAGRWSVTFDPEYQEVWFHRIDVHRGGVVMDRLAAAEFRYLEQEPDSAYHLYNGQVTALTLLPDLRVGDVVDVAYTIRGRNPVFGGRFFDSISLGWGQPLAVLRARVSAPPGVAVDYTLLGEGAPTPDRRSSDAGWVVEWRQEGVPAVAFEADTPSWYPSYPWAQFSEFATWAEVVAWGLPLYEAGFESPDAALRAEVAEVLAPLGQEAEPEAVAVALLEFVQREIRYLGIELGVSSHRPHPPTETYGRRFGDCKDKAVLLVQLLRDRGIVAHPVLVNSVVGEVLRERLPSPGVFDHVIVGIELGDRWHWVDPTMAPHPGTLRHRAAPDYGWGLMIAQGEAALRRIDQPVEAARRIEATEILTSAGFEQPGSLRVETRYHGAAAVSIREYFNSSTPEQISQTYQDYYAGLYPEISSDGPPVLRDLAHGSIEVVETYTVPTLWTHLAEEGTWKLETYALTLDGYLPYGLAARRRTPRALDHAVEVSLRQEVRVHEPWGLDLAPVDIDDPAFRYRRRAEGDGTAVLIVEHHYVSKAGHVDAAAMPAYVQAVNAAREALGLELSWTAAGETTAGEDAPFVPNLLMLVIAAGGFLGANAVVFWWVRHRRRGPPPIPVTGREPLGLGGWLVLPAIALVLSPFRLGYDLFGEAAPAFDYEVWNALTTPGLATTNLPLAVLILLEVLANVGLMALSLWCLALFFRRDRALPTLMRFFLGYQLLVVAGDAIALGALGLLVDEAERLESLGEVFRQLMATALWIPYFTVSQRVRNTFTR